MNNKWIMFFRNGETVLDVVIGEADHVGFPYGRYYITPRHGQVNMDIVIEVREPNKEK